VVNITGTIKQRKSTRNG